MFLRRFFKIGDKVRWLLLELVVVFIGVYLAFLFNSYNERVKNEKEREKVLISLKKEIDKFRLSAPLNAEGQSNVLNKWREAYKEGELVRFDNWRFLEPQYNFQVIEYAINQSGTDIIEFELFRAVSELYREIKQLEHSERMMTTRSGQYKIIPEGLSKNSENYMLLAAENKFNLQRMIAAAFDRVNNLNQVAQWADDISILINERITIDQQNEVAFDILPDFFKGVDGDTFFLKELYLEKFEHLPVDELDEKLHELAKDYNYE